MIAEISRLINMTSERTEILKSKVSSKPQQLAKGFTEVDANIVAVELQPPLNSLNPDHKQPRASRVLLKMCSR